ncbi:hypothetical protein CHARACLAT_008723, partial [Characodon lateralis]|nr:hypothetical protein [Characodon lateralis]
SAVDYSIKNALGIQLKLLRNVTAKIVDGGISNVSLLVNASAAEEAAGLAGRHKIPIGLHANLSEGTPVCQNLQQISTLINPQGFFHGKMGFRQALERGQLSMIQVHMKNP